MCFTVLARTVGVLYMGGSHGHISMQINKLLIASLFLTEYETALKVYS